MKKILITYATAGIGHKKAAFAVKKAFDEMSLEDAQVVCVDALDYTNAFFKWMYLKIYLLMINKLPLIWGFFYYLTDNYFINIPVSFFRRVNNWMNSKALAEYLKKEKFDVIISTHFFASEVISELKKSGAITSRLVTVITDYKLHSWWVAEKTDMYVVGGDLARDGLLKWGVPEDKVRIMGIPVEPVFSRPADKTRIVSETGLETGIFTILVVGGGFGVGPIEEIVRAVDQISSRIQMVVICGHNKELVSSIRSIRPAPGHRIVATGFVDNVYEYMEIADVLISKSGGITVAESMAKGLPMIVVSPILGQETRNCSFLLNHEAAIRLKNVSDLQPAIECLLADRKGLDTMRQSILKIKRPSACFDVAKYAVEMAGQLQ